MSRRPCITPSHHHDTKHPVLPPGVIAEIFSHVSSLTPSTRISSTAGRRSPSRRAKFHAGKAPHIRNACTNFTFVHAACFRRPCTSHFYLVADLCPAVSRNSRSVATPLYAHTHPRSRSVGRCLRAHRPLQNIRPLHNKPRVIHTIRGWPLRQHQPSRPPLRRRCEL